MTTLNRSAIDYVASESLAYSIPVQQGSVSNLCPALTPEGRGVLSWVDYSLGVLRCAVLDDYDEMFSDNVVSSGEVRTIWSSGSRTIWAGCVAVIGDELLAFVTHYLAENGRVECYVANDPEDPTSWALRGTVLNHTAPNPIASTTVRQAGPPTVLPSGRWLLPVHSWLTFATSVLEDGVGLHVSDDDGATWSTEVSSRRGAVFGGSAGPQSTTVGFEPDSGDYVFGAHIGPVEQWQLWRSSDGGASWVDTELDDGVVRVPHFFMDNGTSLYVAQRLPGDDDVRIYQVVDIEDPTSWIDLDAVGIIAATGDDYGDGFQVVPLAFNGLLTPVFTARNRIAGAPRGGWKMGHVGIG